MKKALPVLYLLLVVSVLVLMIGTVAWQTAPSADLIFVNGDIYPGTPFTTGAASPSGSGKRFTGMAVSAGKIVAVGSNQEVLRLKGRKTQVIDLEGRFVMPGFNDAHAHLASGGFEKLNVDLVGAKSLDEMKDRIAARVRSAGPGEWIVGEGWDHTLWESKKLPSRQDIDSISAGHPAIFTRVDGHIAIANTAALQASGITAQTKDPEGGKIDHDNSGDLTGILRETARGLVKEPRPSREQHRRAVELTLKNAAQWGITSAQDNSDWEDFLTYEEFEKEGKLTLRISEWLPFDLPLDQLEQLRRHHSSRDALLHTAMLKGFMDGSLGSHTAAMLAPYADDPGNSGIPRFQQEALDKKTAERAKAGFQIGFHAIGDRGARMALNAFAYSIQQGAKSDLRFRIEHAQIVSPDDFQKFKDLKVIASMQPNHLLTDMNWAEKHVGADRARYSYAWKTFLDDGIVLAFGTDYPVEPITPFRGIYCAVTRRSEDGSKEYYPDQKLTIDQAIAAYTTGSAYAQFAESEKGVLAAGMLADFVVLDRDITKVAPPEILKTHVLRTVVGGKTVYTGN
ncbi:MAG TPA: amidohydrolase [Candidatus Angelobacter sp.]|nr:amidohydrolase [Candidatus Angelobacter sp.]